MYARITHFRMKPASLDAADTTLQGLKDSIMSMPGMQHFVQAMNDDGEGYIIAFNESRETSEANAERVKKLWANFADHLEAMPTPRGFDVRYDWHN